MPHRLPVAPQLGEDRADVEMGPCRVRVLDAAELNVEDLRKKKDTYKPILVMVSGFVFSISPELNVEDLERHACGLNNKSSDCSAS